jgi:hypothetical protein
MIPKYHQTSIVTAFAEEIAFNHQKQLPPDLKTSNLFELNSKMSKLDFNLFLLKNITTDYKLQGGRYCSVGDRIAAQLKLKDSVGKIVTCYVFKKLEKFDFEHKIIFNSILETIWDNDTLICAIATD